jgi:hypothetical protein
MALPTRFGQVPVAEKPRELLAAEEALPIRYTLIDGTVLNGTFVLKVPSLLDEAEIARVRAQLAGAPWEHFSPDQQVLIDAIARVDVLFRDPEKKRAPKWFYERTLDMLDANLVVNLAVCLREHADRYFRGVGGEGTSESAKPRFERLSADGRGAGAPA